MVTDIVDFRAPSAGLTGFAGVDFGAASWDGGVASDVPGAGDAGMVLNLFLIGSNADIRFAALSEVVARRLFRGVLDTGVGLALFVAGFKAVFVGLLALVRLAGKGFLSVLALPPRVDRRSSDDDAGFREEDVEGVVGAIEARFAALLLAGFLFSSADPAAAFLVSSTELVDALDLCPGRETVAEVTVLMGRRPVVVATGRVGGLLSPLPWLLRDIEAVVDLVAELGVDAAVRFVVANGRFGGIPFLRGEFGLVLFSSLARAVWFSVASLSSAENISSSLSSAGGLSIGLSSSIETVTSHKARWHRGRQYVESDPTDSTTSQ